MSVLAPDAPMADALSTGFALLPVNSVAEIIARHPGLAVHLLHLGGRREENWRMPS